MYPGLRTLAMFLPSDKAAKIRRLADKLRDGLVDKSVGVNGKSTHDGRAISLQHGIEVIESTATQHWRVYHAMRQVRL